MALKNARTKRYEKEREDLEKERKESEASRGRKK